LALATPTEGNIDLAGDTDYYAISLNAGETYRFNLDSYADGINTALQDPLLTLFNSAGTELNQNNNHHQNDGNTSISLNSEIVFTADSSATYYLKAETAVAGQTGAFSMNAQSLGQLQGDDFADTVSDLPDTSLALGDSISGAIETLTDTDLIKVTLDASVAYEFKVQAAGDNLGSLRDPMLKLLDNNGQLVTLDDNSGGNSQPSITTTLTTGGAYYLAVSAQQTSGNIGTYTLTSRLAADQSSTTDDVAGDQSSTAMVVRGTPFDGQINFAGDQDWVKMSLQADQAYVIDLLGDGNTIGMLSDGYLSIYDTDGRLVASNDDAGAGSDARIVLNADASGDFWAVAGGNGGTGSYQLRLRTINTQNDGDPLFDQQWYLNNRNGLDLNVTDVWREYSGNGISVGVVDDGIDLSHPDLQHSTAMGLASDTDTEFGVANAMHKRTVNMINPDHHGTPVAGIIAADAHNNTGVVGIAYDADLVGYRVKWSLDDMTQALDLQHNVDVSNNSWGWIDLFGDNFNDPGLARIGAKLIQATSQGRVDGQGVELGTSIIFSAGNSRATADNTNYHNFQNDRHVITVASTDSEGVVSSFSTPGASILVAAFGENLLTTDWIGGEGANKAPDGDYVAFTGTSAAAPVISGVVALMLEANPDLGYRDIQKILALTARQTQADDSGWQFNGAEHWNGGGMHVSHDLGYGLADAKAAVRLAETWVGQSRADNEALQVVRKVLDQDAIADIDTTGNSYTFTMDTGLRVQSVELDINIRHDRIADLEITLTSPDGTESILIDRPTVTDARPNGLSGNYAKVPDRIVFDTSSTQFLGENSLGEWTVTIKDLNEEVTGYVKSLYLKVYGDALSADDQYIYTDDFATLLESDRAVLNDDSGHDTLNTATVDSDTIIDLTAGSSLSSIAGRHLTLGQQTWLEDVNTGDGNDQIWGNSEANRINSGRGNDQIHGDAGNDTIVGGRGLDTMIYAGNRADYNISIAGTGPADRVVTVSDTRSGANDGLDTLTGVEKIAFADETITLDLQNIAPTFDVNLSPGNLVFQPEELFVYELPTGLITDDTGDMSLAITQADGSDLPDWLRFDPGTGRLVGDPPQGFMGNLLLQLKAEDANGANSNLEFSVQVGNNNAPVLDADVTHAVTEDSSAFALNIALPIDPDGDALTVQIISLPLYGTLYRGDGTALELSSSLTIGQLTDLNFVPHTNFAGDAGSFIYQVTDSEGGQSRQQVQLQVDPVNDAPTWIVPSQTITVAASDSAGTQLQLDAPTDLENDVITLTITQLPVKGSITLNGSAVAVNQTITNTELSELVYVPADNLSGSVGQLQITATDSHGDSAQQLIYIQVDGIENSVLKGNAGNDTLVGGLGDDTLAGLAGQDLLYGGAGDDKLVGGADSDALAGGAGADTLHGGSGNDQLDGGTGADQMRGGIGDDFYVVDNAADSVVETLALQSGGMDHVTAHIDYTLSSNVEHLSLASSAANGTGNTLANIIKGTDGANTLSGLAGNDQLWGGGGNDILKGGSGRDLMYGGHGNDTYYVDLRADYVVELGDQGIDIVISEASFTLGTHIEHLTLTGTGDTNATGNSLDNQLTGNTGDNIIAGGFGNDVMSGGAGDDTYIIQDAGDQAIESTNSGTDTIRTSIDLVMPIHIENLVMIGSARLNGTGNDLNNALTGNSSANLLDGGLGQDTLTGGAGEDGFYIGSIAEAGDIVTDFVTGEDLIFLEGVEFDLDSDITGADLNLLSVADLSDYTSQDGETKLLYQTSDNSLWLDDTSGGALVHIVTVNSNDTVFELQSSDIYIT
jgi:Ca2+-binding RTX toxin-like protein/subtilisin-like proprotein convertase family protein